mmetsp:Transcript_40671/g.62031  ORF Transcript_40671/g.62031 Transcript_40671/m.62031 type:complete len:95 (-) Transcript_40671:1960-2244(-)
MFLACAFSLQNEEIQDYTFHRIILSFALPLHVHVIATALLNLLSAVKMPSCKSKASQSSKGDAAASSSLTKIKSESDKGSKLEGFKLSPYKYLL